MKRFARPLLCLLLILSACALRAQTSAVFTVEQNGTRANSINLVFLSEGYTAGELARFSTDVQKSVDFLFQQEPWSRYRRYFNIYRIEIASKESGTDSTFQPRSTPVVLRDTYFESGFTINGVDRNNSITATGQSRAYGLLNKHVPEYDIPVVIVNDDTYGGSGGPVAVATTNQFSAGIVEHELGHSFANLTDEYDVDTPGQPFLEFPNATAKTARADIRWKIWIDDSTPVPTPEFDVTFGGAGNPLVGLYEGANYRSRGWYRPHDNALMRNLLRPPGSITREAFVLKYYGKIDPIDAHTPVAATQTFTTQLPLSFGVTPKAIASGPALNVRWFVNNVAQPNATQPTFSVPSQALGNGTHTIKAVVSDPTDWVRRDPTGSLSDSRSWTVKLSNQNAPSFTLKTPLPAAVVLRPGAVRTLDATATGPGSGPVTYEWRKDNQLLVPSVTTPTITLSLPAYQTSTAGTYTVKISTPLASTTFSVAVAVIDPLGYPTDPRSRIVVAAGRDATLALPASPNLPAGVWNRDGVNVALENGARYAGAATRSLVIKKVTAADAGIYYFYIPDTLPGVALELRVVTAPPDYSAITPTLALPTATLTAPYRFQLPSSGAAHQLPTSYRARLPDGLAIDLATGLVTGTPTAASRDQVNGDPVTFTVGNEFGSTSFTTRLLVRALPADLPGTYVGLIPDKNILGAKTGGRIDLTVTPAGAYTGTLTIGAARLPLKGAFTAQLINQNFNLASSALSVRPAHSPDALGITLSLANGELVGTSTQFSAPPAFRFTAWRNRWARPESADPFKGYQTLNFYGPSAPDLPDGIGYGSITIDAEGLAKVAGRLPDGEAFTTSAPIGPNGEILLFQSLYTTAEKGSFLGVLDLDLGATPRQDAFAQTIPLSWFRPADPRASARTYRAGFAMTNLVTLGGRYTAPASGERVGNLPAATGTPPRNVTLSFIVPGEPAFSVDLDLKANGTAQVTAPATNPNKVGIRVTPSTGAFKGQYTLVSDDPRGATLPRITRKVDFQGLLATNQLVPSYIGYGYVLVPALPDPATGTTPATSPMKSGYLVLGPGN